MPRRSSTGPPTPTELITRRIESLGGWREVVLGRLRELMHEADPELVEEWKWMGAPVWSHDGVVCTGGFNAKKVKLMFAHGAPLKDPAGVFNASLEGKAWRAIDLYEGDKINERAFKALFRAAVAWNVAAKKK